MGLTAGVSLWALMATTALVVTAVQSNRQIDDLEVGYANLVVDLNGQVQDAVAVSARNSRYVAQVAVLEADRDALIEQLSALGAATASTDAERRGLIAERSTLHGDIDQLRADMIGANAGLAALEERLALRDADLAVVMVDRDAAAEEAALLHDQIADLTVRLADAAARNDHLSGRIDDASTVLSETRLALAAAERETLTVLAELHTQRMVGEDLERLLRDTMAVAVDLSAETDRLDGQAEAMQGQIAALEQGLGAERSARGDAEEALRLVTVAAADHLADGDRLRDANALLTGEIAALEQDLYDERSARGDAEEALRLVAVAAADHLADGNRLRDANALLTGEIAALEQDLYGERSARVDAEEALRLVTVAAANHLTEGDRLRDANGALRGQVGALEARIGSLAAYQEEVFAQLRQAIDDHVWAVEQGLAVTGLDIEALIEDIYGADFYGVGGPMVPLLDDHIAGQPGWIDALQTIELTDRAVELRDVANQLPIGWPVDQSVPISSGFGPRQDPINGRSAMHQGVDFDGHYGDPIQATGPGMVVRAEWFSGYGRTVDIDHGFGLVSRYAHLQE
ncbi:MAG: peptidoglycan DD-metalloendopeptidase family protein, partial [Pseudomonadota bacterium]